MRTLLPNLLLIIVTFAVVNCTRYEPNWKSLDSRPLPSWYDESKFGIFIHWGVFSVPSYGTEWFWERWKRSKYPSFIKFMKDNYKPDFTYADFAAQFTAEFYEPVKWAKLFKDAGARYVVLTSKHHEGFTNWPSKVSFNWNSMDVGPKRDLVGELAAAIRNTTDLHFGLYHSLYEWFNPMYLQDKANKYTTRTFPERKTIPELYEIVNAYKPDVIWSDGSAGPEQYWNSTGFLAWLYNDSPVKDTVVTNDRWCDEGCTCKHGGYYTCSDRYNPGKLVNHKWENCMTIDGGSWGYRRDASLENYLNVHQLITSLVSTVSCGGNLLLNVGPTKDGRILPIFEERLRDMGAWLKVNGDAIYSSNPWTHQNDTLTKNVWYTQRDGSVYAISLDWPANNILSLGAVTASKNTKITMLGHSSSLVWKKRATGGIDIAVPVLTPATIPCQYAWTFQINNLD